MYRPLSDSTLMSMSKKEIIEQLRIAEHNHEVCEETINQQYENFQKLLANEREEIVNEIKQSLEESEYKYDDNMNIDDNIGSAMLGEFAKGFNRGYNQKQREVLDKFMDTVINSLKANK